MTSQVLQETSGRMVVMSGSGVKEKPISGRDWKAHAWMRQNVSKDSPIENEERCVRFFQWHWQLKESVHTSGRSRSSDKGGVAVWKNFFSALRASVWFKIRGGSALHTIVSVHMTSLQFKLKNYRSYRDFAFTMHYSSWILIFIQIFASKGLLVLW